MGKHKTKTSWTLRPRVVSPCVAQSKGASRHLGKVDLGIRPRLNHHTWRYAKSKRYGVCNHGWVFVCVNTEWRFAHLGNTGLGIRPRLNQHAWGNAKPKHRRSFAHGWVFALGYAHWRFAHLGSGGLGIRPRLNQHAWGNAKPKHRPPCVHGWGVRVWTQWNGAHIRGQCICGDLTR
jgi:hypothetical protein